MAWTEDPDRVFLVNMITDESRFAQYNPEQLKENFGVSYADLVVPGLSHKRSHFVNTDNVTYNFDLRYRAIGGTKKDYDGIHEDKKFLQALTHPWRSGGIKRGGPPRILFCWPELISLTCKIKSLEFTYTNFRLSGGAIGFNVTVTLEEVRDVFVGSDELRLNGQFRPPQEG